MPNPVTDPRPFRRELARIVKKIRYDADNASAVAAGLNLEADYLDRVLLTCDETACSNMLKCLQQACPELFPN